MKRPPRIEPAQPVTPRRKRGLSGEDIELWERVVEKIKPMRKRAIAKPPEKKDEPQEIAPKTSGEMKIAAPAFTKAVRAQPAPPPLAPIGRREKSQLSRGRKEIGARLDLHGMTQTRAHQRLLEFLTGAHRDGLTYVLVITGKGRTAGPDAERGVLRRQVPMWLGLPEFRGLVVGFEPAHTGHGGEGALYVRVRKNR